MALVLNNFWGAETGGMEETVSATNASASSAQVRNGGYSYLISASLGTFSLTPFESVPSGGTGIILGFAVRTGTTISTGEIATLWDSANKDFSITMSSVNGFSLLDSGGTGGINSGAINTSTWYFIEVYIERVDSGTGELFVDGVSAGSFSSRDLNAIVGVPTIRLIAQNSGVYFDDIYFMSGATSADDRLGGCEIYSYRSTLNSATPDSGTALDTGTWVNMQSLPFADGSVGAYTGTAEESGYVTCDDAPSGGIPSAGLTGEIKAIKGTWRADRGGGSAVDHHGLLGISGGTLNRTRDLDITTSPVNYHEVMAANAFELTSFTEPYSQLKTGLGGGGGLDWKSDGTRFYTLGGTVIREYSVSVAWDLTSTITLEDSYTVSEWSAPSASTGLCLNSDGTKLYCTVNGPDTVYQYGMSTAWDLTTVAYDSKSYGPNVYPYGGFMGDSNTKFYVHHYTQPSIQQYTLSTASDISTAGSGTSISWKYSEGVAVSNSGKYLYGMYGGVTGLIKMSTAWDLSTGVATHSQPMRSAGGISVSPDGTKMFLMSGGNLYRYDAGANLVSPTDDIAIGILKTDGGQDFQVYDMLAQVLHVPLTGGSLPPVSGRRVSQRAMLVR